MPTTPRPSPAEVQAFDPAPGEASAEGGLHNFAELARRVLDCDAAVIRSFDAAQAGADGRNSSSLGAAAFSSRSERKPDQVPLDPCRLSDPLLAEDCGFRFYVGLPLRRHGGPTLGILAALDLEPRELTDHELDTLKLIAAMAVELAEARLAGADSAGT